MPADTWAAGLRACSSLARGRCAPARLSADASQRRTGFADAAARFAAYEALSNVHEPRNVVACLLLQPGNNPVSAAGVHRAMTRRY
jgi:hypothetical protein